MPLRARQVDRLGERIKAGPMTEDDRRLLLEFQSSFRPTQQEVLDRIQAAGFIVTGRPEKTPESIITKLQRGDVRRLSDMQDIAGCRLVVDSRSDQDKAVPILQRLFPESRLVDRRQTPSHGYRAVHLIVRVQSRSAEVQVRTYLQDRWANTVERLGDEMGMDFKHGEDASEGSWLEWLKLASDCLHRIERDEDPLPEAMPPMAVGSFKLGQFTAAMYLVPYIRELSE